MLDIFRGKYFSLRIPTFLLVVLFLVLLNSRINAGQELVKSLWVGKTLNGQEFNSTHYLGKWQLVQIWATWCPNCKDHIPFLNSVDSAYSDSLRVLGINIDLKPSGKTLKYISYHKIRYQVYFDPAQRSPKLLNLKALPGIYLINPQGLLHKSFQGKKIDQQLTKTLDSIFTYPH